MRAFVIAAVLSFVFVHAGLAKDGLEKEIPTTSGKKLTVDLKTGGSVDILGWDKSVVRVQADSRDADEEFEVQETSSGVEITTSYFGRHRTRGSSGHLKVQVPRQYDVEVNTMGGEVGIDNVEGRFEGRTMGGSLSFQRLKGFIDFTTMGGPITLTDSDIDGQVRTMGGEVHVENVTGNVQAVSQGGRVYQKNVINRSRTGEPAEVKINTMGGAIDVDEAPEGASVKTMGGNIHIKSAERHVKATTMGGDIEIETVDGAIDASTMGGDVTATMVGDPAHGDREVRISSMGGDITLTVPAALSMDLDLTIAYTENSDGEYSIESDFPVNLKRTPDWDDSRGTPRKYIYGTGTVSGGKNKVVIHTVNGNITLRRGG